LWGLEAAGRICSKPSSRGREHGLVPKARGTGRRRKRVGGSFHKKRGKNHLLLNRGFLANAAAWYKRQHVRNLVVREGSCDSGGTQAFGGVRVLTGGKN